MAVTPNFGIPLYSGTDTAKLDTLLNGHATALDTSLMAALSANSWFRVGTIVERDALTAPILRTGFVWKDSATGLTFVYTGSAWANTKDVISLGRSTPISSGTQSIGTTVTDVTGMTMAFTLPSSSIVRFNVQLESQSTDAAHVVSFILTNGTVKAESLRPANSSPSAATTTIVHSWNPELTVPAGSHTFKITAQRISGVGGSGNVTINPSADRLGFLTAERIG